MAEARCHRIAVSVEAAAKWVCEHHSPAIGWDRLAALYRLRSREIEIAVMRSYYGKFTWMQMKPDEWEALVKKAEQLAESDPEFTAFARKVTKYRLSRRRNLPFSLWHPAELLELMDLLEIRR